MSLLMPNVSLMTGSFIIMLGDTLCSYKPGQVTWHHIHDNTNNIIGTSGKIEKRTK